MTLSAARLVLPPRPVDQFEAATGGARRVHLASCNDDRPRWTDVGGTAHLVVPYSLTTNDAKLLSMTGSQWAAFIIDGLEVLHREGSYRPAMISIGIHPRIVGQPARFAGTERVLDRLAELSGIWTSSRQAIAEHWARTPPDRA